jgi:hypothetical protein
VRDAAGFEALYVAHRRHVVVYCLRRADRSDAYEALLGCRLRDPERDAGPGRDSLRVPVDHRTPSDRHPPAHADEPHVTVGDGHIVRVLRGPDDVRSWWDPFVAFLRTEHPEFYPVLDRSLDLDPDAHREVMEQLPEYLERYEDWVDSQ